MIFLAGTILSLLLFSFIKPLINAYRKSSMVIDEEHIYFHLNLKKPWK